MATLPFQAANYEVVQNDTGNNETSVTVTTKQASPEMFALSASTSRADYVVQAGATAADDATGGILISSISQNGRDNGEGTGTQYVTSMIDLTGGGYFVPVHSAPASAEYNINFSAGYFRYADGWIGGRVSNAANNAAYTILSASPGLTLSPAAAGPLGLITDLTGGVSRINLTGVNSQTDGVLLVVGGKNENNYALSRANSDGSFNVYVHDNGTDGANYESDPYGFVYVPNDPRYTSGRFDGNATVLLRNGAFNLAKVGVGEYQLTIPGQSPTTGVLLVSAEGGGVTNIDNIVSFQPNGDGWRIQTRDLTGVGLQDVGTDPVASFVFLQTSAPIGKIAAADIAVTQNDTGDTTASVTVAIAQGSGNLLVAPGSTRGDYNLQAGGSPTDDIAQGVLINSVRQNSPTPFLTGAIASSSNLGAYSISVSESTSGGGEGNGNLAAAYFPYSDFIGGWANTSVNGGPITNFTSSPGFSTLSFQEGAGGYTGVVDGLIRADGVINYTNTNDFLDGPGTPAENIHGLIRFDNIIGSGPGQIPAGTVITGARLSFQTGVTGNANSGGPYNVQQLLVPFTPASNWASFGGDGPNGAEVGPVAGTFTGMSHGQRAFANVTSIVQNWINGQTNFGFDITPGTTDGWEINFSENPTVALRPKLEIFYGSNQPGITDLTGGQYSIAIPGVNSQTDGVLLVNSGKDEDNYALSAPQANGTWTVYGHDNFIDGGAYEADAFAFVFIPRGSSSYTSGRILGDASIPSATASGVATASLVATGAYRLTIPGENPNTGVLLISAEGGGSLNVDNIVTYAANGNSWDIVTRDLTGGGAQTIGATDGVVSFVFIPHPEAGLDDGGNLVFTDNAGDLNNRITVSRVGANIRVQDSAANLVAGKGGTQINANTIEVPAASLTGKIYLNTGGGNDVLAVDYGSGAIPEIYYTGGSGGADGLIITGSGVQTATYTPDAAVTGNGRIVTSNGTITFVGLEPVDITGMATATLNLPGSDDLLTVANGVDFLSGGTNPALRVSGSSGGVAIESAAFWNNGTVVINTITGGADGNDTLTVASASVGANSNLTIDTGSGTDVVNINGGVVVTGVFTISTTNVNSLASGTISTGAGLSVTQSGTASTLAGAISGAGAVNKNGAGTLILSGANTFAGGINHSAGMINAANASALGTGTFTWNGHNRLQVSVPDATTWTMTNPFVLPTVGAGGENELLRVGDGSPTAGTTLQLNGVLSGGAAGQIYTLLDSDQGGNHNNTLIVTNAANSFQGTVEIWRGTLAFTADGALGNANNVLRVNSGNNNGGLRFDADNLTLAGTRTIQLLGSEVINTQGFTATINSAITGAALRKNGSGRLIVPNANQLNALTGQINVNQGVLEFSSLSLTSSRFLNIAGGAFADSAGTLSTIANASAPYDAVAGTGTLRLIATVNGPASPDLSFNTNNSDANNANWGTRIAAPIDLGATQRYVFGRTNHNGFGVYAPNADIVSLGAISGAGGLTFIAQNNRADMETPFVLSAANTFTGPVEIVRGSVYLNNPNALSQNNALVFSPTSGNNARLFLYGNNLTISSLTATGAGTSTIANGNLSTGAGTALPAVTLTVNQAANTVFNGSLADALLEYSNTGVNTQGALNFVKAGTGTLTLSGASSLSGTSTLAAGTVQINNGAALGTSSVTVNDGTTAANNTSFLLGSGVTFARPIVVANLGTGTTTLGTAAGTTQSIFSGAVTLNKSVNLQGLNTNIDSVDSDPAGTRFDGAISGAGGVTVTGGQMVQFRVAGTKTYSGPTLVTGNSTLSIWNSNGASTASTIDIATGSTLSLEGIGQTLPGVTGTGQVRGNSFWGTTSLSLAVASGTTTFDGILSGSLNLILNNTGVFRLTNAANTFTGLIRIDSAAAGGLQITSDGALGNPANVLQAGISTSTAGRLIFENPMTLGAGRSIRIEDDPFVLDTLGNNVTIAGNIFGDDGSSNAGGNDSFIKEGSGILNLIGGGTNLDDILVRDGSLLVNSVLGAATVTVSNNATLGGSGTITAPVKFIGGNLVPGNSPGILATGNLSFDRLSKQWTSGGTGAEIPAFDSASNRVFVVNPNLPTPGINVFSGATGALVGVIPIAGGAPNSVAVRNGLVAVGVEDTIKQNNGTLRFFDATTLSLLHTATAGALPDMVTFSPDGTRVLSANEGEPNNYNAGNNDPLGSVTIFTVPGLAPITTANVATGVSVTLDFTGFDGQKAALQTAGVRLFGPDPNTPDPNDTISVSRDLEPEYIAVSPDGATAYITLQENNAVAVLDLATNTFTSIVPLGLKDHSLSGNGLDASDRDLAPGFSSGRINIQNWPVFGMYQPDAVASYSVSGQTYFVTANEGDARDYSGFTEDNLRVGSAGYVLDPAVFPNAATLKLNQNLGRLTVSRATGNLDADSQFERIEAFGARSFSIWSASGALVWDSGDQLERITSQLVAASFNSDGSAASFDGRSDNKGPEPEAVTLGVVGGRTLAFVGLERVGGLAVFDITDPTQPFYVDYIAGGTDIAPEGVVFVPAAASPFGQPGVVVANEVSFTTSWFSVVQNTAQFEINGVTPGTDHDQTQVTGLVDLGGAILQLSGGFNPSAATQQSIVLISNDGTDSVVGTFDQLPEGSKFIFNSGTFYLTYGGGDGNDVVLNSQPVISGGPNGDTVNITVLPGGGYSYQLGAGVAVTVPAATPFTFNGAGGDDLLVVNLDATGTMPNIIYNGGTHDFISRQPASLGDVLRVVGAGVETATYNGDGAVNPGLDNDGSLAITGQGLITFTQLEPIDLQSMAVANIIFANADDVVAIADGFDTTATNPALVVSGTSGGVAFESVHLSNNLAVVIDTTSTDAADTITVSSGVAAHGNVNLTLNTGGGADIVTVAGALTVTGNIVVNTQAIAVNATLTANNVTLTAGGAITASSSGVDVSAVSLIASAVTGIELDSDVTDLTASTPNAAIVIREASAVAVNTLTAGTAMVTLLAGGAITDNNAGATNVTADSLLVTAVGGIALDTNIVQLAASNATTGNIAIVDVDGLTVVTLGAVSGVANTGGNVTLTATDTAAATDHLVVNSNVSSLSGSVTLNAGDNATISANLSAATTVAINIDTGNNSGATLLVNAPVVITATAANFTGNTQADSFNFYPQATTPINVFGLAPFTNPGGDTLLLHTDPPTTNPTLNILAGQGAGLYTFGNRANVQYSSIEQATTTTPIHVALDAGATGIETIRLQRSNESLPLPGNDFEVYDGANNLLYAAPITTVLSFLFTGSANANTVTIDDVNGLVDLAGTVPAPTGVGDNTNVAGTPEIFVRGNGGADALVFANGASNTNQTYGLGTGTGPGAQAGEVLTTNGATNLSVYFDGLEGVTSNDASTPDTGALTIVGDLNANAISVATAAGGTMVSATGYVPFTFGIQAFNSLTVNAGDGADTVTLASLNAGEANLAVTLNGEIGNDSLVVESAPATSTVLLQGGAGNDAYNLGGSLNTVDGILAAVTITDSAGTDSLTLVDSADTSGDTVTITDSTINGVSLAPAPNVAFTGVEALDVTTSGGDDTITTTLNGTNGLVSVNVRGSNGDDDFFLTTADGMATLTTLNLIGDAGSDDFGSATNPIRPLIGPATNIAVYGDTTAITTNPGGGITDHLFLDMTTTSALATVNPLVIVDTVTGQATSANTRLLRFGGIDDIDLYDGGVLTDVTVGDLYVRATDQNDTLIFYSEMGGVRVNHNGVVVNNALYAPTNRIVAYGRAGADYMEFNFTLGSALGADFRGEADNDTLAGGLGADTLVGGGGSDILRGGESNDILFGEDQFLTTVANPAAQRATGIVQPGTIAGNDNLQGGGGNDILFGSGGDDVLAGGLGDDYVHGGDGNDILDSNGGNDILRGEAGADLISGSTGADIILGGSGDDRIFGRGNRDFMLAGMGADQIQDDDSENDVSVSGGLSYDADNTFTQLGASITGLNDNDLALQALMFTGANAWTGAAAFATRVGAIAGSFSGMTNDGVMDIVIGTLGAEDYLVVNANDWQLNTLGDTVLTL